MSFPSNKEVVIGRVGTYLFHWRYNGTTLTNNSNPTTSLVSGDSRSTSLPFWASGNVTAATTSQCVTQVTVYAPGDKFDFNFTSVGATVTTIFLTVTPIRLDVAKPVPIVPGQFTLVRPGRSKELEKEEAPKQKVFEDFEIARIRAMADELKREAAEIDKVLFGRSESSC